MAEPAAEANLPVAEESVHLIYNIAAICVVNSAISNGLLVFTPLSITGDDRLLDRQRDEKRDDQAQASCAKYSHCVETVRMPVVGEDS